VETTELTELLKKSQGNRTLNAYARHADVSAGNLSRIMNGQKPTPEILRKLSEKAYNNITYEQLMKAAGYMENKPLSNDFPQYEDKQASIIRIPILGRIRAGLPILASENWEGEVDLSEDVNADFALRITGDSMSWVGIAEGDLALFRQTNIAQHGDIVAAGVEDNEWCATLKFYLKENGIMLLRAANPKYEDMPITEHHRIIGTLAGIYKSSPSILDYKKFLIDKELSDKGWSEAIEKAVQIGLDNKQVIKLIELFSDMVKHVK
jgi:repressor LexA